MRRLSEDAMPLDLFIQSIEASPPTRVTGTAVFLTSTPNRVPHALLHNLKHNKVLHERVVFLTIVTRDIPYVPDEERGEVESLGCNFYRISADYGFKDDPDVPELLEDCGKQGLRVRHDGDVVLRLARDADRDRRRPAWRSGARSCSSRCRRTRRRRRSSSRCRRIASWSWGRRWSCKRERGPAR